MTLFRKILRVEETIINATYVGTKLVKIETSVNSIMHHNAQRTYKNPSYHSELAIGDKICPIKRGKEIVIMPVEDAGGSIIYGGR